MMTNENEEYFTKLRFFSYSFTLKFSWMMKQLIAPEHNIVGISQFHNNITTALNPTTIAKNPIEVNNLFILVFIAFQFYGLTFIF